MKTLITLISLALFSTASFAESIDFDYVDYRDLNLKTNESGSYSWVSNCTSNDLYWDKGTKSYKKTIDSFSEKGMDIVEINGNTIRTISNSVSSDNTKTFSETFITFNSENSYVKNSKRKTVFSDKTEFNRDVVSEGTYKDGKVVITRYTVDGQEKPLASATSFSVWLDKEAMETYEASTFEPSNVKSNMENPSVVSFMLKSEVVCKTKATML